MIYVWIFSVMLSDAIASSRRTLKVRKDYNVNHHFQNIISHLDAKQNLRCKKLKKKILKLLYMFAIKWCAVKYKVKQTSVAMLVALWATVLRHSGALMQC